MTKTQKIFLFHSGYHLRDDYGIERINGYCINEKRNEIDIRLCLHRFPLRLASTSDW